MNILIIDDQPNILSSLVAGVPWLEMGFSSIFTAQSARQARQIIQNNPLDIVISDIEMPNESGLSLLEWARENGYNYECILLTAHADFRYAKQAISLQVSEYILQPAKIEDIIQAVNNSIKKIESNNANKQPVIATNNFNYAAQNIVIKTLFEEWPTIEASILKPERLEKRIENLTQFGIQCTSEAPCVIALNHIRKWHKLPLSAGDFLHRYQQIVEEALPDGDIMNISYYTNDETFFTVFFCDSIKLGTVPEYIHEELRQQLGASTRFLYATSQIRFLRNTMDGMQNIDNQQSLKGIHDIQLVEISQEELYATAVGSDNYMHYNKLIHEYIQEHIGDAISRTDIADHLKVSPDNVSYIIKETENTSVKDLITRQKMEHAKAMLLNTQYPISEISQKCGYDSFAYFSKVYRATYGITPSQERQEAAH